MKNLFVEVKYDRFALDDEQLGALAKHLSELGPVRRRDAYVERGGIEANLWITLQFIGESALQAIVGQITLRVLRTTCQKIQSFYQEQRKTSPDYTLAIALCLSFDDKDIEINLPKDTQPDFIQSLLEKIVTHLQTKPLSAKPIGKIWIPMIQDGDMWIESFFWESAEFLDRYWGVAHYNHIQITDIYDSDTHELIDAFGKI